MRLQCAVFVLLFSAVACQALFSAHQLDLNKDELKEFSNVNHFNYKKHVLDVFLDMLLAAIQSRSARVIRDLLGNSYAHEGCERTLSKEQVVRQLANLPTTIAVNFGVGDIQDLGQKLLVDMTMSGLRSASTYITFTIDVRGKSPILAYTKQFNCHRRHFSSLGQFDQKRSEIDVFLMGLLGKIRSRSASGIGHMMSDSFTYGACEGSFSKEEIINHLVNLDKNVNFNITSILRMPWHYVVKIRVSGIYSKPVEILIKISKNSYGRDLVLTAAAQRQCKY